MAPTVAEFRERFAEFAQTTDAEITRAIDDAGVLHAVTTRGRLYCAAHLLAIDSDDEGLAGVDGGSGVVKSEAIGPLKIEYVPQVGETEADVFYGTTRYGRRLLALEDRTPSLVLTARVVG